MAIDPKDLSYNELLAHARALTTNLTLHRAMLEQAEADCSRMQAHMLDACPDEECVVCATLTCEAQCEMHFHHDGCPVCHTSYAETHNLNVTPIQEDHDD